MACSGCQQRQKALRQMVEAARRRDAAAALGRAKFVGTSLARDAKKLAYSAVQRVKRK